MRRSKGLRSDQKAFVSDEWRLRRLPDMAVKLAEQILEASSDHENERNRREATKLSAMMDDVAGKAFTIAMADRVFRSGSSAENARQLRKLFTRYGMPGYLSSFERLLLRAARLFSVAFPKLVMPQVLEKVRQDSRSVILPGEENLLRAHMSRRENQGMHLNLNLLGEAILGEGEAANRMDANLKLLENPDVNYISVKISSLYSQINLIAYEDTLNKIKDRLRLLYHKALDCKYENALGAFEPKFINLDMEEYRDLHLTVTAFREVLSEFEFKDLEAGIVLQAYIPESFVLQQELTQWAMDRVKRGHAPIKLRIVKGANLAMEKVEAEIHGWEQAPYDCKKDVDANYKRMLHYGCQPEHAAAIHLGIASHNLFDISYGLLLCDYYQIHKFVEFEMLEGMAPAKTKAIADLTDDILLYAPVVERKNFNSAIAYLIRRLDENTGEENFLRDMFAMQAGDMHWERQKIKFLDACVNKDKVSNMKRRKQNRQTEVFKFDNDAEFTNAADTDWTLKVNRNCLYAELDSDYLLNENSLPLQIGGNFIETKNVQRGVNPSRPGETFYQYSVGGKEELEKLLQTVSNSNNVWNKVDIEHRKSRLLDAAEELSKNRMQLIHTLMLDAAKTVSEADAEVSEAIDFANYYARAWDMNKQVSNCEFEALGTVLVASPWNFPLAIPVGGILAALMAGNKVIFKPAPEATLTGWHLVQLLWRAGIPKRALQFFPCDEKEIGKALICDERVNAVILTGATETAEMFQSWRPDLKLFAETGGKNALIATKNCDRDQLVKDVVKSAFHHSGQKCSAASLLILDKEIYEDENFLKQLKDAAESLTVGSAEDLSTIITPLIHEPDEKLKRALTSLDEGEEWLLKPKQDEDNKALWSPGIKIGVREESFFFKHECFGPVLGIMSVNSLADAIELVNKTKYGLTAGISSLDEQEVEFWKKEIQAGNLYINRPITGAIVNRQPFGGWKCSAFGGGAKAGGPNYVFSLGTWKQLSPFRGHYKLSEPINRALVTAFKFIKRKEEKEDLETTIASYYRAWSEEYVQEHDPSSLICEANNFRYRRFEKIIARVDSNTEMTDVLKLILMSIICNIPLELSLVKVKRYMRSFIMDYKVDLRNESDEQFLSRLNKEFKYSCVRFFRKAKEEEYAAANEVYCRIVDAPLLDNGWLELRNYYREQCVSETRHRYGNIMD